MNEATSDGLWDFAEFCMTEAFLLRSFLENLRTRDHSPEDKLRLLSDWRKAVGLQLGNTAVYEMRQGP